MPSYDADPDRFHTPDAPPAGALPAGASPGARPTFRSRRAERPAASPAEATQRAHAHELMRQDGVLGVGVGQAPDGRATLRVYVRDADAGRALPPLLGGTPVEAVVTGPIRAL